MQVTSEAPRTLYQKIFDGDIPAYKIYDDTENGLMAFLDIKPATPGHTLFVPQEPIDKVYDLAPARSTQLSLLTQTISQRLQERLNPIRVTEHVIGYQIPHCHRMLVPSYVRGDTAFLHNPARMEQDVDHAQLEELQAQLAFTEEEQLATQRYLRKVGGLIVDCT